MALAWACVGPQCWCKRASRTCGCFPPQYRGQTVVPDQAALSSPHGKAEAETAWGVTQFSGRSIQTCRRCGIGDQDRGTAPRPRSHRSLSPSSSGASIRPQQRSGPLVPLGPQRPRRHPLASDRFFSKVSTRNGLVLLNTQRCRGGRVACGSKRKFVSAGESWIRTFGSRGRDDVDDNLFTRA